MNVVPGDLIVFASARPGLSYVSGETMYDTPTYYTANNRVGYVKEDNVSICIATYIEKFSHHDVGWAYIWSDDGQIGWTIVKTKDGCDVFKVVS